MTGIADWPLLRQLRTSDRSGRGRAAKSAATAGLRARTASADSVVKSICPYCAVGCGQDVYVRDGKVVQIEGDPDSPISRGRLCPKGSASLQLTTGPAREHAVLYRRPHGTEWEPLDLATAMDMIAERVIRTRRAGWQWDVDGKRVRRTLGFASLGGATLDNEENYLLKKLFTALGAIQIENQARIRHSSTVPGLGTSFGRGGATTFQQDLQHSDCIVIQGSNMAECHPVGFQWVMEAKARGATVIHVDPRFTRTSAVADIHVPLRAGSDIAFLGGIINHVLTNGLEFRDYVVNYTNGPSILREDFRDTEDLDGVFSGLDTDERTYDTETWQYEGVEVQASAGDRDAEYDDRVDGDDDGGDNAGGGEGSTGHDSARGERHGSGGAPVGGEPERDDTMEHPRCVFQVLKRHFARYTPTMVEEVCGVPAELFARVCDELTANSGRERTSAFAYAVGWTQHTVGVQYIRTAAILQLLLGNIGRPGGGILALRGHASIQGSTDIPTLFNILPGYIPMPHAHLHEDLDDFIEAEKAEKGFWGEMRSYTVSLLKAWWGDAATEGNDYCFDYLPRLTGSHSTYESTEAMLDGTCRGFFVLGENPAVGSANSARQRLAMAELDWLVVRDFSLIESATWWKDGPEIDSGELLTEDIGTEVFFMPAAAHTEKDGSFTNTQRLLQWHHAAVEPQGDDRSELWFAYHLGRIIRDKLAGSTDEIDRPIVDLTWQYPTHGDHDEPDAQAVLAEINGHHADGTPLSKYTDLRGDGSTSCGCWIYCGVMADGENQAARRRPGHEQSWVAPEWGWAWPANRRILYNRASADPDGRPWSARKALVWWDPDEQRWTGHDVPDFGETTAPDHVPDDDATGPDALAGTDAFVMQADGKAWLYAPAGLVDGPLPAHYEPQDSPFANALYAQQRNPVRVLTRPGTHNRYHPGPAGDGNDVFPYVATTYRLTEHHTAGGMSRWQRYLSELQPEMFCEVSPELAALTGLEHRGWATIATARGAIEARVMVTDRIAPLTVAGRTMHHVGLPYHWGPNGLSRGDAANELAHLALDPNVHIQEVKAFACDITPGRRPRGPARLALVREYQRRAGITDDTGTEV